MKTWRALALAAAAAAAGGCTAGAWRDRAHDLAQIFEFTGSVGPGLAVSARATEVAQAGFGWFHGESVGVIDGRFTAVSEHRDEFGVSLLHVYEYRREGRDLLAIRHAGFSDPGYDPYPFSWQLDADRRPLDVGFNAHLAIIGIGMTFRVDELWDFVAGCFGFDPLGDDAYGRPLEEIRRQCASLDSVTRDRAFDALKRRGEATHGYAIFSANGVCPDFQRRAIEEVSNDAVGR
jgi:hypothetical protein